MKLIDKTQSICPVCLKTIDATVESNAETVFLLKTCPVHGSFQAKHPWSNIRDYLAIKKLIPDSVDPDFPDGLLLYLNSRCNQNCQFCFACANEYILEEPDLNKIMNVIGDFRGTYIYLCGGEPTLREDIFEIISSIKRKGYKVGLSTNGKTLIDPEFVARLKRAGLDSAILQFDTSNDEQYRALRGEPLFSVKMRAVDNLKAVHIQLQLFVMLAKGININQISYLLGYAAQYSEVIKVISLNPVWEIGRFGAHEAMGASEVLAELERQTDFNFEDLMLSTEFSYSLFKILRKLTKKGGRTHPQCEIGCYAIIDKTSTTPISRILNLKLLNKSLKKINILLDADQAFFNKLRILFMIPYISLLKDFLRNGLLRKTVLKFVTTFVKKGNLTSLNVVNIIIGTFHTAANIDLTMVNTCKTFSEYEAGNRPSCLRQICFLENIAANKSTVS